jgi:hypothetical protein
MSPAQRLAAGCTLLPRLLQAHLAWRVANAANDNPRTA